MLNLSPSEWIVARFVYIILTTIALIGSISNFFLFFVTIRSKNLRSTCHLLIGFCAFLDGLHHIGQFYQFPILFSDGVMNSFPCSLLQVLPEIGLIGGCACVLCIGIERLTADLFINQYKNISNRLLVLHISIISAVCSYIVYLMVAYYQPSRQICAIPAPFHGIAPILWAKVLGMLNMATIIVYSIVEIVMNFRANISTATRKSFRSIFFVMTSDVCGWAIAISLLHILTTIHITDEIRFILRYVCGVIVNYGIAVKPMIYYSTSNDYRQAFRAVFGQLSGSKLGGTSTIVSSMNDVTTV